MVSQGIIDYCLAAYIRRRNSVRVVRDEYSIDIDDKPKTAALNKKSKHHCA